MAITVTALGTSQGKPVNNVDLTYANGLVAAAGDWLVICFAGDSTSTYCIFYDSSTGVSYDIERHANVLNSGNVGAEVYLFRLPVATAAGDYVRVNTTLVAGPSALTVYKATGIDYFQTPTSYSGTVATTGLFNGNATRVGNYFPNFKASTITSAKVYLSKSSLQTTGTGYVRVRSVADDSIIGTLGQIDVATLGLTRSECTFNAASVTVPTDQPIYILVEYSDGDSNHNLVLGLTTSLSSPECCRVTYASSYTPEHASVISFSAISGGLTYNPLDKSASSIGTGTSPSSGATDPLSQADELVIGVIGCEDVPSDVADTFTAGSGNVSGNEQTTGTTGSGDNSNITIVSAAEVVSATAAQTAAQTGNAGSDWAALIITLKGRINSLLPAHPAIYNYLRM